jgi:acetyl esterase/lipase
MSNTPTDMGAPPQFLPAIPEAAIWRPRAARSFTGLTYAMIPGYRNLQLDVHVPEGQTEPAACVVWIHGGAWLFGDRRYPPEVWPEGRLFQSILDAGLAVATIDYRHSREAVFPAQLHDAKAAIRYLRAFASELGIDPDRIGVWGESAGGQLAALVGLTGDDAALEGDIGVTGPSSAVKAVVDWYGVHDVTTMPSILDGIPEEWRSVQAELDEPISILLGGSVAERPDAAAACSPVTHVSAAAPPFLLMHGDADGLVPFAQSVELFRLLQNAGVESEFQLVPGADHVFLGADPLPLIAQAVEYLRDRL